MKEGVCTQRYPKEFQVQTVMEDEGFPKYRRCNNGRVVDKGGFVFDNRWVVPYNSYLLLKYKCHINVECCNSVTSVTSMSTRATTDWRQWLCPLIKMHQLQLPHG
jgi:hypothetical protein